MRGIKARRCAGAAYWCIELQPSTIYTMKYFLCVALVSLVGLLGLASAGYIGGYGGGWSSPVVYRRVVYAPVRTGGGWSRGWSGGYGGGGWSGGYGGWSGGYGGLKSGWNSGWW